MIKHDLGMELGKENYYLEIRMGKELGHPRGTTMEIGNVKGILILM